MQMVPDYDILTIMKFIKLQIIKNEHINFTAAIYLRVADIDMQQQPALFDRKA